MTLLRGPTRVSFAGLSSLYLHVKRGTFFDGYLGDIAIDGAGVEEVIIGTEDEVIVLPHTARPRHRFFYLVIAKGYVAFFRVDAEEGHLVGLQQDEEVGIAIGEFD